MANRKKVPDSTPKERVRPVRQVWEVDLLVVERMTEADVSTAEFVCNPCHHTLWHKGQSAVKTSVFTISI